MRRLIILLLCSFAFCSCYLEEMPVEPTGEYEEEAFPPLDGEAKLSLGGTISFDWYSTNITYSQCWTNSTSASPTFYLIVEKSGTYYSYFLVGGEIRCIADYYEYGYHYSLYISINKGNNPNSYITLEYWETITD